MNSAAAPEATVLGTAALGTAALGAGEFGGGRGTPAERASTAAPRHATSSHPSWKERRRLTASG